MNATIRHGRPWGIGVLLVLASLWLLVPLTASAQGVPHGTLPECLSDDPDLLLPDLITDAPRDVRELYIGNHRHIRFTTSVGNVGDGPLVLEGRTVSTSAGVVTQAYQVIWRSDGSKCARPSGQFEFHERHRHWHFERFVGYELRRDDPITGELVAGGAKTSFCLLDLEHVQGYHPVRFPRQLGIITCKGPEDVQGISVGWKDVYQSILPGQSIDLDRDPNHRVQQGSYYLVLVADTDHLLWEKDTGNNINYVPTGVNLPMQTLSGPVIEPPTERPRGPALRPPRYHPQRPARPARPGRATPVPTATPQPTATPTPVVIGPGASACDNACSYGLSQLRLTWYDALGLQVSGLIGPGNCPLLTPQQGEAGTISMTKWLTERRQDTGLEHRTSFVLSDGPAGRTDNRGYINFSGVGVQTRFNYSAPVRPFARQSSRADFPVVFEMCLTIGDQAVKMRLVCQAKNTGMLCHQ